MRQKSYSCKSIGQSTVEYAVLLAIVAAALIAMQVYLKRGVQGRIRDLAAQLAPDAAGAGAAQYEAGRTTSWFNTTQQGTIGQRFDSMSSHTNITDTTTRRGQEDVRPDTQ